MPDIYQITDSIKHRYKDLGNGSFAEVVALDTDGGSDREFVVTTYRVKTAFTGASIGDTITATQVIDVSTATPSTITTIWRNQTTAADLASVPSAANLELVGSAALTDAQLRATAVPVSGTVTATGPLTDTQLRASAVPVSGTVTATGPLTDTQLRATAVPVIGPLTDTQLRAARINVEPLGIPGVSRQLAAGAASANTALTAGVGRISIYARNADIRYTVGSASQTASATSHFIAQSERLDIDVPATPNIAIIRNASTDGILEVTELS